MIKTYDCIVIGGGAAGLMCAATAGYRGRKVLILDHANKFGKKILMSGGGRCNFTNYVVEPQNYVSENPHFCKSALSRYTPQDFIDLVDRHNLAFHEKTKGQLFCDHKSSDILNVLLDECTNAGVAMTTHCSVKTIEKNDRFILETSQGTYACETLVIATGGLSIPTMGATGFGYDIAKQFGLSVSIRQPSLVPYTFRENWLKLCQNLSGISVDVSISTNDVSFSDPLLFTHRGISGPAILQITNYWNIGDEVSINFFPGISLEDEMVSWRNQGTKTTIRKMLTSASKNPVAKKFIDAWLAKQCQDIDISTQARQITNHQIHSITQAFQSWRVVPDGTEGYRTAEVTRGGVITDNVSSKTFEAKNVDGLYFIGEVLDVTGWLGGYNFQWAWASGWCAGQYV